MIILSQGLMLEGSQAEASALATLAAEARVSINVLMFAQAHRQRVAGAHFGNVVAGSRSARGRSRDAGVAIARLALSRRGEPAVRLRAPAQRDLGALHARRRADWSGTATGGRIRFACRSGRQNVQVRARRQVQYTVRDAQ